ncbi:MAG TPA: hypothetical protein PLV42_10105, partial [bacterium]|nr:hypothetical protein [bacterium]
QGILPLVNKCAKDIVRYLANTSDNNTTICFNWGKGELDSGVSITTTPEGRLYIGARTYGLLGNQSFGDGSIDSWDAVLLTTTIKELGL